MMVVVGQAFVLHLEAHGRFSCRISHCSEEGTQVLGAHGTMPTGPQAKLLIPFLCACNVFQCPPVEKVYKQLVRWRRENL